MIQLDYKLYNTRMSVLSGTHMKYYSEWLWNTTGSDPYEILQGVTVKYYREWLEILQGVTVKCCREWLEILQASDCDILQGVTVKCYREWLWNTTVSVKYCREWPVWNTTGSECEICSSLEQWFMLGKADHPLLVTSNWNIPVKHTLRWNAVAFCACDKMQLFPVVFCVVRAVYQPGFRLAVNKTPNK